MSEYTEMCKELETLLTEIGALAAFDLYADEKTTYEGSAYNEVRHEASVSFEKKYLGFLAKWGPRFEGYSPTRSLPEGLRARGGRGG